ncbi:MAG: gfo/Idh/MocA family oxidoreductase [Chitinophagaceae bacterium]|nr:gfo/Idh/MocA family oxidoreductase [Chitinophagaceae bacterium]
MKTRRVFIKNTLGSIAALTFADAGFASCLVPRRKEKLGVALVGLGYYSTGLLAPALQLTEHCYLAGIVTGSPDKAKNWQQQYNIPEKNYYDYARFDEIANNPDIDVVYIVLPPSMHEEYVIKAANAGKHVWCEKPMALNAAECRAMIEACHKNKVKLSIGYRLHHEPNTQKITQMAKTKPYGTIKKITAVAGYFDDRTNHWKQKKAMGGGCMYDMGVYSLNAARYVTGEEPVAVTARASTTRPAIYTEVEETINFTLEFPGGAMAGCESSFGKNMNALKVDCSKGWYTLEPFSEYSGQNGVTSDGEKLNVVIPNQQARQMDDDALAILQNKDVLVPGEEGLNDILVVEAIYESVKTKARTLIKK